MITKGDKNRNGAKGPLVLGASGRIGNGFRRLAQAGLWPGPPPVWQFRPGKALPAKDVLFWDILRSERPTIENCRGIVGLAGAVRNHLGQNTDLALAAIDLAAHTGCGPVLLMSTSAVYGRGFGVLNEAMACSPVNAYGLAKLEMEKAIDAYLSALGNKAPQVCILRVGNVAGADTLLEMAALGHLKLDQFSDGQGPVRNYIGMQTLADVVVGLFTLAENGQTLPSVLNVAAQNPVQMSALLSAAGLEWHWVPAPETALQSLTLDTSLLASLVHLDPNSGSPAELIRQARLIGWTDR